AAGTDERGGGGGGAGRANRLPKGKVPRAAGPARGAADGRARRGRSHARTVSCSRMRDPARAAREGARSDSRGQAAQGSDAAGSRRAVTSGNAAPGRDLVRLLRGD